MNTTTDTATHTYTGARAERFLTTGPDGHIRVDYTALDNLLAEAIAGELANRYRRIAGACHRAAGAQTGHSSTARATRAAYRQLAEQADTIAAAEQQRAARRRERAEYLRPQPAPHEPVALLATVAERLRQAGAANHLVPVRVSQAAGWFRIAAQLHAAGTGCPWCATGRCPAVEAARLLCGQPASHRAADHDHDRR